MCFSQIFIRITQHGLMHILFTLQHNLYGQSLVNQIVAGINRAVVLELVKLPCRSRPTIAGLLVYYSANT